MGFIKLLILFAIIGATINQCSKPSTNSSQANLKENSSKVIAPQNNSTATTEVSSASKRSGDPLINKMIADYESNQARFHTEHKGKQIQGMGVVSKVEADVLGIGEFFTVDMEIQGSKVSCSTNDKMAASSLNKGENINFSGEVDDVVFERLWLRRCSFEKRQ
jgi:hypothetical protein